MAVKKAATKKTAAPKKTPAKKSRKTAGRKNKISLLGCIPFDEAIQRSDTIEGTVMDISNPSPGEYDILILFG